MSRCEVAQVFRLNIEKLNLTYPLGIWNIPSTLIHETDIQGHTLVSRLSDGLAYSRNNADVGCVASIYVIYY